MKEEENIKKLNAEPTQQAEQLTPEQLQALEQQMQREFTLMRLRGAAIELKRTKYEAMVLIVGNKDFMANVSDETKAKLSVECSTLLESILNIPT